MLPCNPGGHAAFQDTLLIVGLLKNIVNIFFLNFMITRAKGLDLDASLPARVF